MTVSVFDPPNKPGQPPASAQLPLYIDGQEVAAWKYTTDLTLDRSGQYLKVKRSNFTLYADVDREPLVRYEFDADMTAAPVAHWQFHAERGAFSYLLGVAKASSRNSARRSAKPHVLRSLHFPVGGARMRVGLEDLLQFLIVECYFDAKPGWQAALETSRNNFRQIQVSTLTRDAPHAAAKALRRLGWIVEPPSDKVSENNDELRRW